MIRLSLRHRSKPFLYPGEELMPLARRTGGRPETLPDGNTRRAVETGRTRLLVTAGLFALAFSLVGGRLIDVMVLKARPEAPTAARSAATEDYRAGRADIVDRHGLVLATNLPTVDLYANAPQVAAVMDPAVAADELRSVLPHLDRADLIGQLSSGRAFVYLDRDLTPRQKALVNAKGIPGVYFRDSERRVYPQGRLVSHVLGATDPDNTGIAGIEAAFDDRLKSDAAPLRLSLDLRVQAMVHQTLAVAMDHFHAKGAVGVVLDVTSGEVLSLVSLPDYEPERFGEADQEARFNRATLGVYEMGSTFKLFNTAMALESGQVRLSDTYDTTKPLRVARYTIRDSHPEDHWMNVPEILIHSSNIGSARMAMAIGGDHQQQFLKTLGLLDAPTIELPERGAPLYPSQWRESNTMTISFGHGIAVTPISLAAAVGAVVNGGILRQPTVLAADTDTEAGTEADTEAGTATDIAPGPAAGSRVLSEDTSRVMRKLMRMVVTEGTASKADVPGYIVGGKTGTAEKVAASGGYDHGRLRTTFAAAFPMDAPRYVVITVLDEPQALKSTYGFATSGWNAAPTAGAIIRGIAPLLGILPRPAVEAAFVPAMPDKGRVTAQSMAILAALPGGSHAPR
jgi:cell division protein FtsI (penicillin-binding protein 3)